MSDTKSRGIERAQFSTAYHDEPEILALRGEFGPIAEFISIKIICLILSNGHYYPDNIYTRYRIAQLTGAKVELVDSVIQRMADYGLLDRELLEKEHILTGYELQRFFYGVTARRADSPERNKHRIYRSEEMADEEDDDCGENEMTKELQTTSRKASKNGEKTAKNTVKNVAKTAKKQPAESACEADSAGETTVATDDCRAIVGTNSDFACKNRRSNSKVK